MKTKINFQKVLAAMLLVTAAAGCQKENINPAGPGENNVPAASTGSLALRTGAPERTSEVVRFLEFIQDYNYQVPVHDTSLVFEAFLHNPVLAPDGHQLTLAEFSAVSGNASMKCVNSGTHISVHLRGLIPNGVYSIFVLTFQAPGFTPSLENLLADGALGAPDGSRNTFTADANGEGAVTVIQPAGPLSEVGSVDGCLADSYQVVLSGIYHIDGTNYGGFPGPLGTWAFPFAFVFTH